MHGHMSLGTMHKIKIKTEKFRYLEINQRILSCNQRIKKETTRESKLHTEKNKNDNTVCQPYGTEKASTRELSVINAYNLMIGFKK